MLQKYVSTFVYLLTIFIFLKILIVVNCYIVMMTLYNNFSAKIQT